MWRILVLAIAGWLICSFFAWGLHFIRDYSLPVFGSMLLALYVLHSLRVITYDADNPQMVHHLIVLGERYL